MTIRVVDADAHVEESEATWSYLEPDFKPRRPIPITLPTDTEFANWNGGWIIDGKFRHNAASPTTMQVALYEKDASIGSQELTDVPARLSDMDRLNCAAQVVFPS